MAEKDPLTLYEIAAIVDPPLVDGLKSLSPFSPVPSSHDRGIPTYDIVRLCGSIKHAVYGPSDSPDAPANTWVDGIFIKTSDAKDVIQDSFSSAEVELVEQLRTTATEVPIERRGVTSPVFKKGPPLPAADFGREVGLYAPIRRSVTQNLGRTAIITGGAGTAGGLVMAGRTLEIINSNAVTNLSSLILAGVAALGGGYLAARYDRRRERHQLTERTQTQLQELLAKVTTFDDGMELPRTSISVPRGGWSDIAPPEQLAQPAEHDEWYLENDATHLRTSPLSFVHSLLTGVKEPSELWRATTFKISVAEFTALCDERKQLSQKLHDIQAANDHTGVAPDYLRIDQLQYTLLGLEQQIYQASEALLAQASTHHASIVAQEAEITAIQAAAQQKLAAIEAESLSREAAAANAVALQERFASSLEQFNSYQPAPDHPLGNTLQNLHAALHRALIQDALGDNTHTLNTAVLLDRLYANLRRIETHASSQEVFDIYRHALCRDFSEALPSLPGALGLPNPNALPADNA